MYCWTSKGFQKDPQGAVHPTQTRKNKNPWGAVLKTQQTKNHPSWVENCLPNHRFVVKILKATEKAIFDHFVQKLLLCADIFFLTHPAGLFSQTPLPQGIGSSAGWKKRCCLVGPPQTGGGHPLWRQKSPDRESSSRRDKFMGVSKMRTTFLRQIFGPCIRVLIA